MRVGRDAETFGHVPAPGTSDADDARERTAQFRRAIRGSGVAAANPQLAGHSNLLAIQPQSPGLAERTWWGSGTRATARRTGEQGMNLMSSTLLTEDTGAAFGALQAEQIAIFRQAWADAGHPGTPRVSVSRSIMPLITEQDRRHFGLRAQAGNHDQVGHLDGGLARFGTSYIGEPDVLVEQLAQDAAVRAADTVPLTVRNQLGVGYNAQLLDSVLRFVAPGRGWRRSARL
nr:hypothetical protein BJQ95_00601 [Cryobacterium sp. SO1]